jgi:hypothetical protein
MSKIKLGTAIAVMAAVLLAAAGVSAQRSARSNVNSNRNTNANVNRNANANVNRNANANVNRNTNLNVNQNTNVNVNRDVDVNVNHNGGGYGYGCCYQPGIGAAVAATAVATAAVIGTIVNGLPPSCTMVAINGISYQQCGSTWYQPRFSGSSVTYVVIAPPR